MKNSNEQKLQEVISELLETYKLQDKITETRLVQSWEKVAGHYISSYTERIYLHKKKLFVKLTSPALKHELSFAREKLVNSLNDAVKQQVIEDIVFL